MRAINRPHRTPVIARATAFLAAAMLAISVFSSPASAATPNWSIDPVVSLPTAVTPGDAAGYLVTIRNAGPSSISQLYLTAYLGTSADPAPNPVFTSTPKCPITGGTLFCSFGSLKKGASVSVTVAFTTPSDATSFSIRFEANTTGATSSDGGNTSHGDTIERTGTTNLTNDPDFAGRFVTGELPVANNQTLGAGNPQTTQVGAPGVFIGVTVEDGTPASNWCPNCTSESSEVHVNNGVSYSGGFRIDIQVSNDLFNGSITTVYHQKDDLTIEPVTTACPKSGNPNQNQMPCFKTTNLGGGDVLVTIWTKVNGKWGM